MIRIVKTALGLGLLLAPLAGWGQSEWKWLTGGNLKAVKFVGQKGWIIGDDGNQGIILHTTNGGDTWAIQPHNTGRLYFNGLSAVDSLNVWIVGGHRSPFEQGFMLRTRDGGRTWVEEFSVNDYYLSHVCFIDTARGWYSAYNDTIYRTTDGGRTWGGAAVLYSGNAGIIFVDALRGWTVRGGGVFTISSTTDGGLSWTTIEDISTPYTGSITMSDSLRGWSAGQPDWVVRTTNGWKTWTQHYTGGGGFLNDISFYDSLNGFIVGGQNNHPAQYYKTTNGGLSWAVDSITQNRSFAGVDAKQLPVAWIAGEAGSILKTTTSGNSWVVTRNADIGRTTFLNSSFRDINQGWAVGTYGAITHTTNGGTVWQLQNTGTLDFLYGVDFPDSQRGWVCGTGGKILTTTNAGVAWTQQTSNTSMPLLSIDFSDTNTLVGVAVGGYYGPPEPPIGEEHGSTGAWGQGRKGISDFGLRIANWTTNEGEILRYAQNDSLPIWGTGLDFYKWPWRPEETALTTPYRTITRTTNGGALWIAQNTSGQVPLYGVSFVTPREGWACGDPQGGMGVILHTTDSGATWTGQSSNVNQGLYWIQFRDRFHGWTVGNAGTALWTTDGGNTWNPGNTGTTLQFLSCAFYDTLGGFACGGNGTLFKTTDGGRNWQPDTSKTNANLMAVFALDSLHAWTVGSYGMVLGWRLAGTSGVEQGSTGAGELRVKNGIKAWPNPFVSYARVAGREKDKFALYDVTGRRVGTYKGDKIGGDVTAGVYFLMADGKEAGPVRIVKVR